MCKIEKNISDKDPLIWADYYNIVNMQTSELSSILIIKPTRLHQFLKFIFGIKLYMFRKVPPSIITSFSPYTQQWYMSYRCCCVYGEKLLMTDGGTVRNVYSFIPKMNLRN